MTEVDPNNATDTCDALIAKDITILGSVNMQSLGRSLNATEESILSRIFKNDVVEESLDETDTYVNIINRCNRTRISGVRVFVNDIPISADLMDGYIYADVKVYETDDDESAKGTDTILRIDTSDHLNLKLATFVDFIQSLKKIHSNLKSGH
ncbi:hypothetical protein RF11_04661 [Thelohanellus kitauei]|uniref:Uncharacterized protein n=1 Tax=Thelohanellus kitauei TaxID=669202 RepID=A0A0C2N5P6_THEKT|nr:hypothetical protein RF11_04661 [Thelohanellus kitauei]